ncbi:hypothetical protein [Caldinitratiruptor microaerophilus]|uniref:Uncharacterized protein n=1 Tax=Caldinitratiruptor microaerophilus TaxID=671077 RepID=A0AA35CML3_9FIRM|nr:hypothetical protein [Caldinitratiruptor microaerophilus]BDG62100.1 hypothetical protein caldi_31900 [Caldinitratiruptor microaerophilus]
MTHPSHTEGGHGPVPRWLLVVYLGIRTFFVYYIITNVFIHGTHPTYRF